MKKIAVVSDVHGNYIALEKILFKLGFWQEELDWKSNNEYFIVFCGDINDYGDDKENRSSVKCLQIVMELVRKNFAICVHSNHQDKLLRYLNGNNVTPSHGLNNTIKEIELLHIDDVLTIKDFLESCRLFYEFCIGTQPYIVTHAYFDDMMFNAIGELGWEETKKTREWIKANCIYGLTTKEGRVKWYEDPEFDRITKFKLICGHFHIEKFTDNYAIIDDEEFLTCYIPEEGYLIKEPKIC